jgi:hypothetical protein
MIPVEEVTDRFGEYIAIARKRMGVQDGDED